MINVLTRLNEKYSNYTYVFTGHSMGAAVSNMACMDAVMSGTVDGRKTKMYNFGQPRVGNKAYAEFLESEVSEIYRVNHHRDLWTHIPPCVEDLSLGRKLFTCKSEGDFFYYPWQTGSEVFYDSEESSYRVCKNAEDYTCSNKYFFFSPSYHDEYLGVSFSTSWKK